MTAHIFRQLANYNRWANAPLYAACQSRHFAFNRCLLNHLLLTDRIWLKRLTGEGDQPNQLDAMPASRDSRASVRHNEGPHGSDTLPHQNASKSSCRDGSLGPDGREHRRDQAADGCDRGLRPTRSWHLTDLPGKGFYTAKPSRPREFHPELLTDPDLILSHHPARAID
jgi:hypothetical protein